MLHIETKTYFLFCYRILIIIFGQYPLFIDGAGCVGVSPNGLRTQCIIKIYIFLEHKLTSSI
jgi:hypothetical protein